MTPTPVAQPLASLKSLGVLLVLAACIATGAAAVLLTADLLQQALPLRSVWAG